MGVNPIKVSRDRIIRSIADPLHTPTQHAGVSRRDSENWSAHVPRPGSLIRKRIQFRNKRRQFDPCTKRRESLDTQIASTVKGSASEFQRLVQSNYGRSGSSDSDYPGAITRRIAEAAARGNEKQFVTFIDFARTATSGRECHLPFPQDPRETAGVPNNQQVGRSHSKRVTIVGTFPAGRLWCGSSVSRRCHNSSETSARTGMDHDGRAHLHSRR